MLKIKDQSIIKDMNEKVIDQNVYNTIIAGQREEINLIKQNVERDAGGEISDARLQKEISLPIEILKELAKVKFEDKKGDEKSEEKTKT